MSLTKPLNSKVNMKQYSNADLPVNPKQPAVARYAAESTSNQTVINLPFQVDTVNAADSFMLMVDGKVLTPGSTNDYQFSGVDSFGFSSSVTLNYSLVAGLNVQAIKLGLKKETEFVQDARFTALYEGIDQGLQGFVRSDLMLATTATGAPAAGLFHSTVQNRAPISDLRNDLKARMGIERMMFKTIVTIPNEIGPNGETVSGVTNDPLGLIRIVGDADAPVLNAGQYIRVGVNNALTTGYIEITFYGTGLNILTKQPGATHTAVYSVDGSAESANFVTAMSTVLEGRMYSPNIVQPVVNNLALGVHTVRIRNTGAASLHLHGIEILNQVATVNVQPGSSYLAGKKLTTIAQSSLVYNTTFESGILGTKGGRVLVYQKSDGSIVKAVQPTDISSATFSATNHQNEEIARIYNWREFGAGRADDYSTLGVSAGAKAFTLDDGTTTLQSTNAVTDANVGEALTVTAGTSNYTTLTFVGTGLDVELIASATGFNRSMSFTIDGGASIGTVSYPTSGLQKTIVKIASGLPYGTHSVRFINGSASLNAPGITRFIVYQPKKPTLPAGAFEIADYNVVANYDSSAVTGTAVADHIQLPQGSLFKAVTREFLYVGGAWSFGSVDSNYASGIVIGPATSNGQPVSYSFFGTGLMLTHLASSGGTYDFSVTIDGALNASGVTKTNASNLGAGSYRSTSTTSGAPCRVEFTGLSLGFHTVTIQRTAGAGSWNFSGLHIITPIHSYKPDLYFDIQNTLSVGSVALSDNRSLSITKEVSQQKASAIAHGIASGPTTSSTAYVPMPDMSLTVKTGNGVLDILGMSSITNGVNTNLAIFINGVQVQGEMELGGSGSTTYMAVQALVPVTAGVHKIDIYWKTSSGTATARLLNRTLKVKEL